MKDNILSINLETQTAPNVTEVRGKDYIELDDNMYCPKCGEKFLFPFNRDICWDCHEYQTRGVNNQTFLVN